MSIEDDLLEPPSITEGDHALALFTDRYELTRLFVERLNDDPASQTILFFYGEGGNGKSLLLKYLRRNACKRLAAKQWQQVKAKPDVELADIVSRLKPGTYRPIPSAFLDFGSKPLGDVQPQDRFFGLLTLRKELAVSAAGNAPLKFRRFDFACVWYLFKKGRSPEEIKSFFPADQGLGLATSVIDTLTDGDFGGLAKGLLDLVSPNWSQRLQVWRTRFGISKDEVTEIVTQDLDTELIDALPGYLAADLNEAMAKPDAPPRVVLFFDTHEAFWGENRSQPKETYFFRDEWLRRLLRKLDYEQGIVAVVAGRDRPRWAETKTVKPHTDIPERYVEPRRVGNLSESDALAYLQQPGVGITDEALGRSLIAYASVETGEVHPLHLGLCADVVLQAQAQGNLLTAAEFDSVPEFGEKSKLLIERLLKYVSAGVRDALYALSACRAFDFELYNQLGEKLKFASNRADFDLITRFSFVKQLPEPRQQWYRLHGLLRRLNAENGNERVVEAHYWLEQHHQENEQSIEAIYHTNQLSPRQGIKQWIDTFELALKQSKYPCCETLLEVRPELKVTTHFDLGLMSLLEGRYHQILTRFDVAEDQYSTSIWASQKSLESEGNNFETRLNLGNAYAKLGCLRIQLSKYEDAFNGYRKAIETYDQVLKSIPDYVDVINSKAAALQGLAKLQETRSRHTAALKNYQQSIETCSEALHYAPDHVSAFNNKGLALQQLGNLQANLAMYPEAQTSFKQSTIAYDEALHREPDYPGVFNNKGLTLQSLGNLQRFLSKQNDAME